ncbi:di-trans,poly-cis-decaprenylcistransferase [Natronolimnobius sp. AArcel1]|uniref:polyprenyl diphosphate synthase n=1 Tax=Natronolimnobius sp. AArcel1 TaxID=1679093 RepID=UPI0013EA856C|nr:polyprenyl diphosphate synthase [Natronolimnobius sp. AArcel1]NGM70770.1 di-trans,poly-cis-decaprenylcistransferase [Natronolimnobius sp. AArcel1]
MKGWIRDQVNAVYGRVLSEEVTGTPTHVAVIQDGNRRYARQRGNSHHQGHRAGAQTTEQVLEWCQELGIKELTLYAFSTENFKRPAEENEPLFDLFCEKLHDFADADRVHQNEVQIRAIGATHRLPDRVQDAITYATERTQAYDKFTLNIALAYGGRSQLLEATRSIAENVESGVIDPSDIDLEVVENELYEEPIRDVDLIIRTGGGERTSNFLPWHANGNEAAVFFSTPYWPEFSKTDFLRGIRTYEHRQESWERTRARRALALVQSVKTQELPTARKIAGQLQPSLPVSERPPESNPPVTESADN